MFRAMKIVYLKTDDIKQSRSKTREVYDPAELYELSKSIKTCGILNPVTVRKCGKEYILIAGERRIRAAKLAGIEKIPAIVYSKIKDETADLCTVSENLQRKDISYFEEGRAFEKLVSGSGDSIFAIAEKLGKSPVEISDKIKLSACTKEIKDKIRELKLPYEQAKLILMLENDEERKKALSCRSGEKLKETVLKIIHDRTGIDPIRKQIVKSARVYENTISAAVKMIRQAGNNASETHRETDEYIEYTIKIAK